MHEFYFRYILMREQYCDMVESPTLIKFLYSVSLVVYQFGAFLSSLPPSAVLQLHLALILWHISSAPVSLKTAGFLPSPDDR